MGKSNNEREEFDKLVREGLEATQRELGEEIDLKNPEHQRKLSLSIDRLRAEKERAEALTSLKASLAEKDEKKSPQSLEKTFASKTHYPSELLRTILFILLLYRFYQLSSLSIAYLTSADIFQKSSSKFYVNFMLSICSSLIYYIPLLFLLKRTTPILFQVSKHAVNTRNLKLAANSLTKKSENGLLYNRIHSFFNTDANYQCGILYKRQGENRKAINAFLKVSESSDRFESAQEAIEDLSLAIAIEEVNHDDESKREKAETTLFQFIEMVNGINNDVALEKLAELYDVPEEHGKCYEKALQYRKENDFHEAYLYFRLTLEKIKECDDPLPKTIEQQWKAEYNCGFTLVSIAEKTTHLGKKYLLFESAQRHLEKIEGAAKDIKTNSGTPLSVAAQKRLRTIQQQLEKIEQDSSENSSNTAKPH